MLKFLTATAVVACVVAGNVTISQAQNDSVMFRKIYDEVLLRSPAYRDLEELSSTIGPRLSGSKQAQESVKWTEKKMREAGADSVWLQEVWVPHWVRGAKESAAIIQGKKRQEVPVCALGMSIATPPEGITAPVIEVTSFDELRKLGTENIKGKIVFYNHPMDQRFINTFEAYGEAGRYRYIGAAEAARYGAVASITRSLASADDDYPHTGAQRYNDSLPKIPCAAISTNGANLLSRILKADPSTQFFLKQSCEMKDSVLSWNVIGDIRGTEFPDQIVLAGAHLDSWDLATGATDDGAGIVQTIEIIRVFKELGIRPKRTVRIVAFMNEENGLRGGRKYAEEAFRNKLVHIAAMESDAGATTPYGFGLNMSEEKKKIIQGWAPLFRPYLVWNWDLEFDGADISPMTDKGVPGMGLMVDSQRYFTLHHASTDTFDKINKREMDLGSAAMAAMVYMISYYGL